MKNISPKSKLLIALLMAVLLVGGTVLASITNLGPFAEETTPQDSIDETNTSGQDEQAEYDATPDGPTVSVEDERPQQADNGEISRSPNQPASPEGSITISRIEADDPVTISAIVHGINNGVCTVTYQQGMLQVQATAPVQAGPTYFGCQISIPRSKFTNTGRWNAELEVRNSSAQARAASEVTL